MDETVINLDLKDIDRQRLESITNAMASMLFLGDVLAILAEHNVHLKPTVEDRSIN